MPSSLSQGSIPVFEIGLNALSALLDKATAFAAAKKIEPAVLLHTKLAPDMFDFTRQVQVVTDQARRGAARLAGVEPPSYQDTETTIDQLKARLAKTVAYLKTLDAKTDRRLHRPRDRVSDRCGHNRPHERQRLPQSFRAAELLFPSYRRLRDPASLRRRDWQARLHGRHPRQGDAGSVVAGRFLRPVLRGCLRFGPLVRKALRILPSRRW